MRALFKAADSQLRAVNIRIKVLERSSLPPRKSARSSTCFPRASAWPCWRTGTPGPHATYPPNYLIHPVTRLRARLSFEEHRGPNSLCWRAACSAWTAYIPTCRNPQTGDSVHAVDFGGWNACACSIASAVEPGELRGMGVKDARRPAFPDSSNLEVANMIELEKIATSVAGWTSHAASAAVAPVVGAGAAWTLQELKVWLPIADIRAEDSDQIVNAQRPTPSA